MTVEKFSDRYDRNLDTLSHENQKKLGKSKALVLGLGGLGGGVCEMLARTGVGHLMVVDGDSFESSNLNRQLLSQESLIGESKARAAENRIRAINSDIRVTRIIKTLDESNLYETIKGQDVVVDCLDSIQTRFKLQAAAKKASVPIVSGAIAGVTGQVTTIFPGDKGYALIYGDENQARATGVETRTGNISYCAMLVAAIQSSECIKVLLNRGDILQNKLLIAELWSNTFEVLALD